jgi:regulatory protein
MKIITAITAQKRNPNRVNSYVDGEYAFSLARIVAAWLKTGDRLDEEKLAGLQAGDDRERAYQQAMLFLSYRARSEAEIRQNLLKHEFPEAVIEETLERLRQARLADDSEFARAWVENRSTFRPRSRRALAMEMRRKGLSDENMQSALEGLDEEALAYQAAGKRLARLQGLEWNDFRKKLSEFLGRRGFPYPVIAATVSRLWDEMNAGQEQSIDNEEPL